MHLLQSAWCVVAAIADSSRMHRRLFVKEIAHTIIETCRCRRIAGATVTVQPAPKKQLAIARMQGGAGGKTGRQNPKSKITSLNSQLAELESELAAVERDCAQLEEENRALLEQAQEREAEVERERAKIARTMPTATGTGSVGGQATQVRRHKHRGSVHQGTRSSCL